MSKISWSEANLPTLGRKFLRNVLDNMRGYEDALVQFGETGEGVYPNYQITFPNGKKWPINGRSHDSFGDADQFDINKISNPFHLHEIQAAYENS